MFSRYVSSPMYRPVFIHHGTLASMIAGRGARLRRGHCVQVAKKCVPGSLSTSSPPASCSIPLIWKMRHISRLHARPARIPHVPWLHVRRSLSRNAIVVRWRRLLGLFGGAHLSLSSPPHCLPLSQFLPISPLHGHILASNRSIPCQ